jgi:hypothetical protein
MKRKSGSFAHHGVTPCLSKYREAALGISRQFGAEPAQAICSEQFLQEGHECSPMFGGGRATQKQVLRGFSSTTAAKAPTRACSNSLVGKFQ